MSAQPNVIDILRHPANLRRAAEFLRHSTSSQPHPTPTASCSLCLRKLNLMYV
jgi:hypothetical protein